ncbi:hypothetical protein BH11ARM1_BH11ARM1_13030 [soil metagenome]
MITTLIFSLTLNSTRFEPLTYGNDPRRERSLFPDPDAIPFGENNIWAMKETKFDWYTIALFPGGEWNRRLYISRGHYKKAFVTYLALEELRNHKAVPVWKVAFSEASSGLKLTKIKTGTLIAWLAQSNLHPVAPIDSRAIALLSSKKGYASYEFDNGQLDILSSWVAPSGINKLRDSDHEIRTGFNSAPITGFDYPMTKEEVAYIIAMRRS